jgi:predicted AAA+ superfamily ATPase
MTYINRKIEQQILSVAADFPAVVVTGARQIGKTTLLRHLFPDHNYVTLDRPLTAEQAEVDPEAFLAAHPAPVIIDEIQYAPSLFRFLKLKIDARRAAKGQYLLTGSQKFTLMQGVTDSLAGRAAVIELEGLSCLDLAAANVLIPSTEAFLDLLHRGSYPELWTDTARPAAAFFDAYIATYLERDVKQVLAVGNLRDFERFLRGCALRTSQQLNKSDLARDVGISVSTAGEWLSVLEALGQIVLLEPWFSNLGKRLAKAPKIYLADPALVCALSGLTREGLSQSPMIGALWETFVYAELRKQWSFAGIKPRLWYYRDQSNRELDFISEQGHDLTFYECKWTSSPQQEAAHRMLQVERIFTEKTPSHYRIKDKVIVSRASETFRRGEIMFRSPFAGLGPDAN